MKTEMVGTYAKIVNHTEKTCWSIAKNMNIQYAVNNNNTDKLK